MSELAPAGAGAHAPDARWRRALEEHRAALRSLVAGIESAGERLWAEPRADGAWTPAQLAEHLALTYEVAIREMREGTALRLRTGRAMRTLLRWVLLPHILFHRTLPVRARSPREARPESATPISRGEIVFRLRERAEEFERAVVRAHETRTGGLTHPYFGWLPPLRALRFVTVHLEHHTRQLVERARQG